MGVGVGVGVGAAVFPAPGLPSGAGVAGEGGRALRRGNARRRAGEHVRRIAHAQVKNEYAPGGEHDRRGEADERNFQTFFHKRHYIA